MVEITIKKMPKSIDFFERRVKEHYISPKKFRRNKLINKKGLYASIIVPEEYNKKFLNLNYNIKVINLSNNLEEVMTKCFKQKVIKRHLTPEKSRNYYNEHEYLTGTSPKGYYTTIICPKELIGKIVRISE